MSFYRRNTSAQQSERCRYRPSLEVLEDRLAPAVFTVTRLGDAGVAQDIRWAVNQANAAAGADTISFNIPGGGVQTINLSNTLTISDPVTIDGFTQPGAAANTAAFGDPINATLQIVLRNAAAVQTSIKITGNDSTIKGLVIHGFNDWGIIIEGKSNKIQGCFIGTNAAGTDSVANTAGGILIGAGADQNLIGGTNRGDRNLISGNKFSGVSIQGAPGIPEGDPAEKNIVQGNYIGTDLKGTKKLSNEENGVWIIGPANENLIGGPEDEAPNLISGNKGNGVSLQGGLGLTLLNKIVHNRIGTNGLGTAPLGNDLNGVVIVDASFTSVGGSQETERNIISGNLLDGVVIIGSNGTLNQVTGNYIGTDLNGTAPAANPNALGNRTGVNVQDAGGNNIGGSQAAGQRNVISGNNQNGIRINNSVNMLVQGNFIGVNKDGDTALRNGANGVVIEHCTNTLVGGTDKLAKNVISGNGIDPSPPNLGSGVVVTGGGSSFNRIQGNYIGTNAEDKSIANQGDGISIEGGARDTTVGGETKDEGNIIGTNKRKAIDDNTNSVRTIIKNNVKGKGAGGPLPNEQGGASLDGSQATVVQNEIWYNIGPGVAVVAGTGHRISQNSIALNAALGIDLGNDGVTVNDAGDIDEGPNNLQNYPELSVATTNPDGTIHVEGTIDSFAAPDPDNPPPGWAVYPITIEFFFNTAGDASGYGEGEIYLGSRVVQGGPGPFDPVDLTLPPGTIITEYSAITATATDSRGNTSEFSLYLPVDGGIVLGLSQGSGPTSGGMAITIRGANFRNISRVLFGATPAVFTVLSPTRISAIVPPSSVGTVDVRVVGRRGPSPIQPGGRFTYMLLPPPPPPPAPPSAADFPSEELSSGSESLPDEDLASLGMLLSGEEEGDFVGESTVGGFSPGGQASAEPVPDPLDPSRVDDLLATLPVTQLAKKDGINRNDSLKKFDLDAILTPPGKTAWLGPLTAILDRETG